MDEPRFHFEALQSRHDRAAFSCGSEPLDRYFRQQAGQDVRRHVAGVFVMFDTLENRVAGYYTLSASGIESADLPDALTRRLPHYPILPAVLLGRLAVDSRYRGQGLGRRLLLDALFRARDAAAAGVAAIAVVVDALDDSARLFYEHHEFKRFVNDDYRLFLPMTTIVRL